MTVVCCWPVQITFKIIVLRLERDRASCEPVLIFFSKLFGLASVATSARLAQADLRGKLGLLAYTLSFLSQHNNVECGPNQAIELTWKWHFRSSTPKSAEWNVYVATTWNNLNDLEYWYYHNINKHWLSESKYICKYTYKYYVHAHFVQGSAATIVSVLKKCKSKCKKCYK